MVPAQFVPTFSDLRALAAAKLRVAFPSRAHDAYSFLGQTAVVLGMTTLSVIKKLKTIAGNQVPGYDNDNTGAAAWARCVGVPSNNPNARYGPNVAQPATGGVVIAKGTSGSIINDGTALQANTGVVDYITSGGVTIPASGEVDVNVVAVTPGTVGNLAAGNTLRFVSPPVGVQADAVLKVGLDGGLDNESLESTVSRTLRLLRSGKRGGTASDFRTWSENYLTAQGIAPGLVKRAWCYPLRGGLGTVHVVITGGGSGLSRQLTALVVTAVLSHLNRLRHPGVKAVVLLADMSGPGCTITMRCQPSSAKKYAWSTPEFQETIVAVPADNKLTLGVNLATTTASALVALRTAIDAGREPILQISSASSVLPVMVRAIAYTNAMNSVLTLRESFSVGSVSALDTLRAGSEIVLPVAQAIRDHVDQLGPSRQSGYADPYDGWSDTLSIGTLNGIPTTVLDPVDRRTKVVANVGGTLINNATLDITARDVVVGGSPQLLYLANAGIVILPL